MSSSRIRKQYWMALPIGELGKMDLRSRMNHAQLSLGLDADEGEVAQAVEAEIEKITYVRHKSAKPHPGRIELPSHLPVVETIVEPAEDVSQMRCIGHDVTEELELQPASMFIKRTRRPKYAAGEAADGSVRIVVAPMHKRPIDKCMAGVELLTTIVTDKHATCQSIANSTDTPCWEWTSHI